MRDNNSSIRVSRSLRDTAYKAIYAKEGYVKKISERTYGSGNLLRRSGLRRKSIVFALDAIQLPVSLYEPIYSEGGDTLYVMDQVSDRKNREENWVEELSLEAAMERLNERERYIISTCDSSRERHRWRWRSRSLFLRHRSAVWRKMLSGS